MLISALLMIVAGEAAAQEYRLGEGDVVAIQVFNEPQLSREVLVTRVCSVEVELIGPVVVCDRTPAQVARDIEAKLADGYLLSPTVIIEVKQYGSQKVEVRGAIKTRGIQMLKGPTSLSEIITAAGGPEGDNVVEVDVIRPDGARVTYLLSELSLTSVLVEGGDVVVLRQGRHVFVKGEVEKPGAVPFQSGLTVTQALTLAGGESEYASLRRAYVLKPDGQKILVNIKRINEGVDADVVLEPEDQLIIRPSFF